MDIVTYVLSGALRHGDSMGNSSVIHAGEFQHIYAGTRVRDSEMNASDTESVHLLQIWIIPERAGGAPTYFQVDLDLDAERNTFVPVASPEEHDKRATLRSDIWIYMARLGEGATIHKDYEPGRAGFLHIVDGIVDIDGHRLSASDGLQFAAADKPIACICHGKQILVAAGVLEGKKATAYPAVKPEVERAGRLWCEVNETFSNACVDGNLVTAPAWPAHPDWIRNYLHVLGTRIVP
jgi:redox-sensitive bicupin YhaK (pirin superfamily)